MTAIERVEMHHLFNDINQAKPSFFLDLRDPVLFQKCHFRQAKNLAPALCLSVEEVTKVMSHLRDHNQIALIYLVDDSVSPETLNDALAVAKQWMSEAQDAELEWAPRWKKIMSVSSVNFDTFYATYPNCSSLYIGSDFPDKNERIPGKLYPTDILPQFLYLGSFYDANEAVVLTELGITHVLDATSEHLSAATAEKLGLKYLPIAVWDMEGVDIAAHFETVLAFIAAAREAQGRILVHCRAGISRSATFVLAHLMHTGHCGSLRDAVKLVVEQRPYVLPNPSFREQLRDYEMSLFSTRSFATDQEMMEFISTMNFCWSGIFSLETDFDKIPIIAASQRINDQKLLDEFPTAVVDGSEQPTKPKKVFLKRGEGKAPANKGKVNAVGGADGAGADGGDAEATPSEQVNAGRAKQPSLKERMLQQKQQQQQASQQQDSGKEVGGTEVKVVCAGSGAVAVRAMRVGSPLIGDEAVSLATGAAVAETDLVSVQPPASPVKTVVDCSHGAGAEIPPPVPA